MGTEPQGDGATEERNLGIKEGGPFGKPKGVVTEDKGSDKIAGKWMKKRDPAENGREMQGEGPALMRREGWNYGDVNESTGKYINNYEN